MKVKKVTTGEYLGFGFYVRTYECVDENGNAITINVIENELRFKDHYNYNYEDETDEIDEASFDLQLNKLKSLTKKEDL